MHKVLSIMLVLAVLLAAACSPENQGISGTASITVTVSDDTAKTISPDGNADITHYVITAINEAESISESSEMLAKGESYTVSNVPAGVWKAKVDAYIQRGSDYVYAATAESAETRVPADSTVTIPVSLEGLLDELSGDVTVTLMMPAELDDEGDGFHYTYEIRGTGQRAEYSYVPDSPIAGTTGAGGSAGITIDSAAAGLMQGSYLLAVTVFDGETEETSDVVRTGIDAMRLIAGVDASGTIDMRSQELTGFRISVTDTIGEIIEPEAVDGKQSYEIEATGSLTEFTVSFAEVFDPAWTVEWYLDGSLAEAEADGASYRFSIPKGKHSVLGIIRDEAMAMSVGSVLFDVEAKAEIVIDESSIFTFELNADGKAYTVTVTVDPMGIFVQPNSDILEIPSEYKGLPVTKIGNNAFENREDLTGKLIIPEGIAEIGNHSFSRCEHLTDVAFPDSLTAIGDYAFLECYDMEYIDSLVIPDNVVSIGIHAFKDIGFIDCTIELGNSLETIGASAFENAWIGEDLVIPDSVKTIGEDAFYNCTIDGSLILGKGIETIGDDAFREGRVSGNLILPENLTAIGEWAFYDCDFTGSLIIPENVMVIGSCAFRFCDFTHIYCEADSQPTGWDEGWNYDNIPVTWGYAGE